jgi:hypothetical protein
MTNLRPPDECAFVEVLNMGKTHIDAIVKSVGPNCELEVGQKIGTTKKIFKVEVQGADVYSVNMRDVLFISENG